MTGAPGNRAGRCRLVSGLGIIARHGAQSSLEFRIPIEVAFPIHAGLEREPFKDLFDLRALLREVRACFIWLLRDQGCPFQERGAQAKLFRRLPTARS